MCGEIRSTLCPLDIYVCHSGTSEDETVMYFYADDSALCICRDG